VLRVIEFVSREMFKLPSSKRIFKVLKDVIKVLSELFFPKTKGLPDA
jgi:hypothetical protein